MQPGFGDQAYGQPPGGTGGPGWGGQPMQPAEPPKKKRTGCIIAVVVALVLVCLGGVAVFLSCGSLFSFGQRERINQISMQLHASLTGNPNAPVYEQDLRGLEQLNRDGNVSFMAFGVLENRVKDAALDGVIDAGEMDHVMALVRDINAGNGNISLQSYPQGR